MRSVVARAAVAAPAPGVLCSARPRASRTAGGGRAPAKALRARCSGGVEAQAREDGCAPGGEELDAVLAAEELEMLEDEAMGGADEGRRPTDYDRRAHIFEESSRVFRALKQRRDCDGGGAAAGTAVETTRGRHEPQRLE